MADIPGLIEGAHQGHGLGDQFLRHVERTRLLAHLLDVSGDWETPEAAAEAARHDFDVIMEELRQFNADLAAKPMVVVASKIDSMQNRSRLDALEELCRARHLALYPISSHTGEGIERLTHALVERLAELRAAEPVVIEEAPPMPVRAT
jgi:GTP-binding protein